MPDQLLSLCAALFLFPLVLWIPGAVLGYTTDLLGFRTRSVPNQLALGLLFSMATCPIVVYNLMRVTGFIGVWVAYGLLWAASAALAVRHRQSLYKALQSVDSYKPLIAFVIVWFIFGAAFLIDIVLPTGVWRNMNTMDAVAHVAFTDAITRTGVPPVNPFTFPGYPIHLFYYYLWYLMCSIVDQLGGPAVTARAAVQAGTIYLGLAVASLLFMYLQIVGGRLLPLIPRVRTGVALALFTITGLDLIPWLFLYLSKAIFHKGPGAAGSIEWWNEQVTAWLGAIVMSPHHPVGLVICFTGVLLLLWTMDPNLSLRQKLAPTLVASLAFASAAGVSLYVTFAMAVGLLLWAGFAICRGWGQYLAPLVAVGAMALALYIPFALELRAASHETEFPLALTVRAFVPVDYWLPSIVPYLKTHSVAVYLLRAALLPVNYGIELGFFLVGAVLYWRYRRLLQRSLGPEEVLLTCLGAGSILVCTFLRSAFRWNDLGWRAFLVAQFVLLIWCVPVVQALLDQTNTQGAQLVPRQWRKLLWFCLVIGVAGTVVEMANMRIRSDGPTGPSTLAVRDAYIWVDRHTPRNAILLFNPDIDLEYFSSLYGYRQTVCAGRAYGTYFSAGKDSEEVLQRTTEVFGADQGTQEILSVCRRYQVGVIVVLATDPVWKNQSSWVWHVPPSYENEGARVFLRSDIEQLARSPQALLQ